GARVRAARRGQPGALDASPGAAGPGAARAGQHRAAGPGQRAALHRGRGVRRGRTQPHPSCRRCNRSTRRRRPAGACRPMPPVRTMSRTARWALALAWVALLVLAGAWLSRNLEVAGDLRRFMPEPRTPEQKLLVEGVGEGPGSRLLLVALEGDAPDALAAQSAALAEALSADPHFALVANGGRAALTQVPGSLRPYRYLLSPTLDRHELDEAYLRDELQARLQDLGSPAGHLVEPLLPADPTLEVLALAEQWQGAATPRRLHGVW